MDHEDVQPTGSEGLALMLRTLTYAALIVTAGAATALACNPDPSTVRDWAFAKQSPIPITDAPGKRKPTGAVRAEFARAYAVIGKEGRREVKVCMDGAAVWARRSDFLLSPRRTWIDTDRTMASKDRPRLEFWESPDRLRVYVGGETDIAPPRYREARDSIVTGTVSFPVIRIDFVEMGVGNREVEIANVLVPFSNAAVAAYETTRDPEGAGAAVGPTAKTLGLVVDISGSTQGYVEPHLLSLVAALRETEHLANARIVSAGFGGDGKQITALARGIDDGGIAAWPVKPAEDGGAGTHDLAAAVDFVARNTGEDVPLMVFAGGDVSLAGASFDGFADVNIGQTTPELQDTLKTSAGATSGAFHEFGMDLGARIAARIAEAVPPPAGIVTDESAFIGVVALMGQPGMLAILPHDIAAAERLAVPPVGSVEPEWFATEMFMVVRNDLLKVREE